MSGCREPPASCTQANDFEEYESVVCGWVVDATTGATLSDYRVWLNPPGAPAVQIGNQLWRQTAGIAKTMPDGSYRLKVLKSGRYDLLASGITGHQEVFIRGLDTAPGEALRMDIEAPRFLPGSGKLTVEVRDRETGDVLSGAGADLSYGWYDETDNRGLAAIRAYRGCHVLETTLDGYLPDARTIDLDKDSVFVAIQLVPDPAYDPSKELIRPRRHPTDSTVKCPEYDVVGHLRQYAFQLSVLPVDSLDLPAPGKDELTRPICGGEDPYDYFADFNGDGIMDGLLMGVRDDSLHMIACLSVSNGFECDLDLTLAGISGGRRPWFFGAPDGTTEFSVEDNWGCMGSSYYTVAERRIIHAGIE